MTAKWATLLALLALPVLALAQPNSHEVGRNIPDRGEGGVKAPEFWRAPESRAANPPVFIGRMWNAYSPQSAYTNLIYYDPFVDVAAIVHRTDRTGAGSGYIVYQTTTDGGVSWSPQIGPINAPGFFNGRHPNLLIANPARSNDRAQTAAVMTYNDLTVFGGSFGDVWYVTDKYAGSPTFFGNDSSMVFSYAGAVDLNNGDCYFATISINVASFAVSKVSNSGTALSPKVILAPPSEVIVESGAAIDVGKDGTVHWVGRARWRKSAGAPDENTFYWRYQRSTDGGETWSAPEYVGPQVAGLHNTNYEFDVIVDANDRVHIAALLVDSLAATGSGVALYDLVRSPTGVWHGDKVTDIRVPQFIPPEYAAGGIGDLNAPEFAKSKDGENLALKWIDIIPNPVTHDDSTNQEVFIASRVFGSSWTTPRNVSNAPQVRETFTNLAPIMRDDGQLFIFYISPSVPGTDDLSEHDIWFLPDAKVPIAKVNLSIPDTLQVSPGQIIDVPISLALGGNSIAALGANIKATNKILSFAGFIPGSIIPGERFNVNAPFPDSVILAFTDFGGGPIQQDGVLVTLQFQISPQAEAGAIAKLDFSGVFASDPQFMNLPVRTQAGLVTVVLQPVTVSIADTLTGAPSDTITVPVRLAGAEHPIEAFGAAIKANNGLLSFVDFVQGPIIPGATLNVNAPAQDSVRLAYINFGGGPIVNDGVFVALKFRIKTGAPAGAVSVLAFSDLSASDSNLRALPVRGLPGKVTVVILPAAIHGMKWHDLNSDGKKDPNEPGLEGWQINLTGDSTASTTTDSLGNYQFTQLAPGDYVVAEVLQTGWTQSFPPEPETHKIVLLPGQSIGNLDFGNWKTGEIRGTIWRDLDADEIREENEPIIKGWRVNLAGAASLSTTTDTLGNYAFASLVPGTYTITVESRDKWRVTFPRDSVHTVELISAQVAGNIDFALEPPVAVEERNGPRLPATFELLQNYPNPFNPTTTIKYGVPRQSRVKVELFNTLGISVAVLVNENHQPGYYTVKLERTGLPSGMYFYKLTAPGWVETKKMLLMK
ncbi:cohesin domain-containing protein [candidate division KSB1 bacterium]|nr:cohesin domain-containing protein [candidate division KSB1 bacterium]